MPVRRLVVVSIVFAVSMLVATAAPAAAGQDSSQCSASCAGQAYFYSYGEYLDIYDKVSWDGMEVVVINYRSDRGGPFYGWTTPGTYYRRYNLSMPEGALIDYQVCLGSATTGVINYKTCAGRWQRGVA